MNRLQKCLTANAIFSTLSGLTLILFHQSIATLFDQTQSTVFWIIGIGLLFFALSVGLEVSKQRPKAVWGIIAQDYLWVIGSVILLLWNPFGVSKEGNVLILLIAIIVFIFGTGQAVEMKKMTGANKS